MKKLLTTILILINFAYCFAQSCNSTQSTITTSTPATMACTLPNGNKVLSAQDMVTITGPTTLNNSNTYGYTFTIKTDNSIVVATPTYLSSLVNGASRALDINGSAPGSIGGTINVSATGVTTYNIPIAVPPGSHGIKPNLSVTYASKSGNNILGYGWQLSGLSTITRVSKKPYYDSLYYAPITMTSRDDYSLDGQRLICTDGTNLNYHPENDPYTVVTLSALSGGYFTVTTQDGTVMTYGNSSAYSNNSRFCAKGQTIPVSYGIDRVTDHNGNYIQFNYLGDNTTGEYRINQILYTGNGSTQPYNSVEFYYQKRTDADTIYSAGGAISKTLLLTSIKTFAQSTLAQDYEFSYYYDGLYSKLNQVSLTSDGIKYNPTIVNWGTSNYNVTINDKGSTYGSSCIGNSFPNSGPPTYTGALYFGDFNGDGLMDYATNQPNEDTIYVYLAQQGGTYSQPYKISFPSGSQPSSSDTTIDYSYATDISTLDINNDGKDEIMLHYNIVKAINGDNVTQDYVDNYSFNGTGFVKSNTSSIPLGGGFNFYCYGDFNGDGKMDQVCVKAANDPSSTKFYFYFNGQPTKGPALDSISLDAFASVKALDFDGDGVMELLCYTLGGKASIYKYNNDSGYFVNLKVGGAPGFRLADWHSINGLDPPNVPGEVFIGDFNGDGKSDILFYSTDLWPKGSWNLWYSTGTGFVPSGKTPPQMLKYGDPTWATGDQNGYLITSVYVTDLNNDGKTDIVYAKNDSIFIFLSTGNGFTLANNKAFLGDPVVPYVAIMSTSFKSTIVGNQTELLFGYTSTAAPGCKSNCISLGTQNYKEFDFKSQLDTSLYVSSITEGNNINTTVTYKNEYPSPSATANFPVFPVKRMFLPVSVVSQDLKTGIPTSDLLYTFTNGYSHRTGKGLLGYQNFSVNDILNDNTVQSTNYNFKIYDGKGDSCYYTWPYSQTTNIDNKILQNGVCAVSSKKNYMWAKGGNPAKKLFRPVTTTSTTTDLLKGNYTKTDSVITFNTNIGRVTDRISIASDGKTTADNNWQNEIKSTYNTVHGNGSVPIKIISKSTLSKDTHTDSTNYFYNSTDSFRITSKVYQGIVTDKYTNFDNYGNITGETVSVTDGTPSRTTSCNYDNYGLFKISSTDAEGNTSLATYRAIDGAPLTVTDPNGLTEIYNYSTGGNIDVTQVTSPDGNISFDSTAWDASGTALIRHAKGVTNGNTVTDYINAIGEKLKETAYGYNKNVLNCTYTYNTDRTVNTTTDNANNVTTYSYNSPDGSYRLYTVTGLNTNLQYTYGNRPYTISIYDNISHQTKTDTIDELGNVTGISSTEQNIHNAYYASGKLKSMTNVSDGTVISMTYDPLLLTQLTLNDPDAGIKRYKYNDFGQMTSQTDTLKSSVITYDPYGRIQTETQKDNNGHTNTTTYNYSNATGKLELLHSIIRDSVTETFSYDALCRPIYDTTSGPVPGTGKKTTNFITSFAYNSLGQVSSVSYPSGLTVSYSYDAVGNLSNIANATFGNIWTGDSVNLLNQWTKYSLGNGLITTKTYDTNYHLSAIKTGTSTNRASIQNMGFTFNQDGQLTGRSDLIENQSEGFKYDLVDRLTRDSLIGKGINAHVTSYANDGNISTTTWGGTYQYDPNHPHAVTTISGPDTIGIKINPKYLTQCTYNADNQILTADNVTYHENFTYGATGSRFRVDFTKPSGNVVTSKVYLGNSEFGYNHSGTNLYQRTIIHAPTGVCAVFQDSAGVNSIYYVHTDYLGSWLAITNNNSKVAVVDTYSYDAWGRPRTSKTWKLLNIPVTNSLASINNCQPRFDHGYTGHEHLPGFGLINCNARLYDPYSQRFMSPDRDIKDPTNAQNLNRYTYCLNNPFRYTDPSGNDAEDAPSSDSTNQINNGRTIYVYFDGTGAPLVSLGDNQTGYITDYTQMNCDQFSGILSGTLVPTFSPDGSINLTGQGGTYLSPGNPNGGNYPNPNLSDADIASGKYGTPIPSIEKDGKRIQSSGGGNSNTSSCQFFAALGLGADVYTAPISISRAIVSKAAGDAFKAFTRSGTVVGAIAGGIPAAINMWNNGFNWSDAATLLIAGGGIIAEFTGAGEAWDSVAIPVSIGVSVVTISNDIYSLSK